MQEQMGLWQLLKSYVFVDALPHVAEPYRRLRGARTKQESQAALAAILRLVAPHLPVYERRWDAILLTLLVMAFLVPVATGLFVLLAVLAAGYRLSLSAMRRQAQRLGLEDTDQA